MSWALSPRFLTVLLYTGFHNLELGAKHRFLVNAEHEAILSLGGRAEIGGTDSKAIGTDRFSTIVPSFFSGKGFGVLPDFVRILRPLALTGQVGDSFPTRSNVEEKQASPQTWNGDFRWGRALFICKASERIICSIISSRPQPQVPAEPICTNIFAPPLPSPKRFRDLMDWRRSAWSLQPITSSTPQRSANKALNPSTIVGCESTASRSVDAAICAIVAA